MYDFIQYGYCCNPYEQTGSVIIYYHIGISRILRYHKHLLRKVETTDDDKTHLSIFSSTKDRGGSFMHIPCIPLDSLHKFCTIPNECNRNFYLYLVL